MAWVTAIGPAIAQVDYRLEASAGCGLSREHGHAAEAEAQAGYRMDEADRLTWFGGGLAEVGITAGAALAGEADKAKARALMDGVHPQTGERLVEPKRAAHPRGKLPAAPFLAAVEELAAARGVPATEVAASRWGRARLAQMTRMVAREGETHRVAVKDLERLAGALGVDLGAVYEARELTVARAHRAETVRVGDRGFDLTIDIPKTPSVWWALADPQAAALLQNAFREAVTETLAEVERWCGYVMRGKHGDGRTARRIPTSGLLGWVMWHDVARPVAGQTPDPHLHAHAVIAHMVCGADGRWSTLATAAGSSTGMWR
ncbi:relaxase domain-containing protein [Thermomonospora echinospora]|uniref:relaxase domain-containing protein n=1 Tax=Thermomonospora echinospora TaxID=1992 RepID=UPI00135B5D72|nr:relaxase domain-containing protein [Thermomonospora echinospora]